MIFRLKWKRVKSQVLGTVTWPRSNLTINQCLLHHQHCLYKIIIRINNIVYIVSLIRPILFIFSCLANLFILTVVLHSFRIRFAGFFVSKCGFLYFLWHDHIFTTFHSDFRAVNWLVFFFIFCHSMRNKKEHDNKESSQNILDEKLTCIVDYVWSSEISHEYHYE